MYKYKCSILIICSSNKFKIIEKYLNFIKYILNYLIYDLYIVINLSRKEKINCCNYFWQSVFFIKLEFVVSKFERYHCSETLMKHDDTKLKIGRVPKKFGTTGNPNLVLI